MLVGKQFRFNRSVTGVQLVSGKAHIVTIPTDGVIEVLSGPNEDGKLADKGLVYVIWDQRTVAVFGVDIKARASEIVTAREVFTQTAAGA